MQIGYIGLGKMGKNMVLHLLEKGHQVVAWNRSPEPRAEVAQAGAVVVESVEVLVSKLTGQKIIWLMLPSGDITHEMIVKLSELLSPGDILIDGSNNLFKNTVQHGELLKQKKIQFLDVGVSGGPAGARNGACLMIGGDQAAYTQLEPLFQDISAPNAYQFFPGVGSGHFVKMVHNGIEYGMMQAIGEGFELMKSSHFNLDLQAVAKIYNTGSVIESRLIGWLLSAYQKHGQDLQEISGSVGMLGEGEWTVQTAREMNVPVPVIEESVQFRIQSKGKPSYTGKVVSALRGEFGGHEVRQEK